VRDQLDTARTDLEQAREKITELRGTVAGVTAERDAARSDVDRERTHGEQRVTDLRETYERQVDQLRAELTQVRTELTASQARRSGKQRSDGEARPTPA
jgi:predicted  nucleic acid-binding Zn-ribbon protein